MNAVACLAWVRRGAAKTQPDRVRLSDNELSELIHPSGTHSEDEDDSDAPATPATAHAPGESSSRKRKASNEERGSNETSGDQAGPSVGKTGPLRTKLGPPGVKGASADGDRVVDTYGLDDYDDDDDDVASRAISMTGLAYYGKNADDPYLRHDPADPAADQSDSSEEELEVGEGDNLLVVGKTSGDQHGLEVWLYSEGAAGALYCHHDYILPAFPLALAWVGIDPADPMADRAGCGAGNFAAVGSTEPHIDLWDLDVINTLEPTLSLGSKRKGRRGADRVTGHTDAVLSLSWNALTRTCLASGSADKQVGVWDLCAGRVVSLFGGHADKVQSVAWHPVEATVLLSGSFDGSVVLRDVTAPSDTVQRWTMPGEVERVLWDPHSPNCFLASTDTGHVLCVDVRGRVPLFDLPAHPGHAVTGLALSTALPGCLLSASDDQTVRLWDIRGALGSLGSAEGSTGAGGVEGGWATGRLVTERKCKMGAVFCAAASPDSALVFAAGGETEMKVLNFATDPAVQARFLCPLHADSSEGSRAAETTPAQGGVSSGDESSDSSDSEGGEEEGGEGQSTMKKAAAFKLKKKKSLFEGRKKMKKRMERKK